MRRSLPIALAFAAACAPAVGGPPRSVDTTPFPAAPMLQLRPTLPAATCTGTNPAAILDGEALLDDRDVNRWSLGCLPTAKTASDDAIRGALAFRREDLLASTHGVWVTGDGYGRRTARWMVRIDLEDPRLPVADRRRAYFVDGAKPVPTVDAFRPAELAIDGAVRRGSNPYPVGHFFAVDAATWTRGRSPLAEPPPPASAQFFLQEAVETTRFRVARFTGGCLEAAVPCDTRPLVSACAAAQETGCVEPLRAGLERAAAAVREAPRPLLLFRSREGFRWLLSEQELLDALAGGGGPPVDSVEAVRALELARGERSVGTARIEPARGGFRIFDEGGGTTSTATCSGTFVDGQGVRTPACVPAQPCHAPTARQKAELRHLEHAVPTSVCEEEDGCYALPVAASRPANSQAGSARGSVECPCSERVCRAEQAPAAGLTVMRPLGEKAPQPFLERFCPLCPGGPNR